MAKKQNGKEAVIIGVGLAAVAAAAAGAYFLYGTEKGARKRKEVKGWMLKAKGEMLEKMESLKDVSEDAYNDVVDSVTKKYAGVKNVDSAQLETLVRDVKSHWKNIKKHLNAATKKPAKKKRVSKK